MAYLLVYRKAITVDGGLPAALQSRMLLNIALDFGIGLVPFLGDVADAWFKANTRNAWLLEEYLLKKAEAERRGGGSIDRGAKHVVDAEDLAAAPSPPAGVPAAKIKKSMRNGGLGNRALNGDAADVDVEMGVVDGPRR